MTDLRPAISVADLAAAIGAGTILVPCGLASLRLAGAPSPVAVPADCVAADALTPRVRARDGTLALLPPGLVTPSVKVLQVGDADLFGAASHRSLPYPLSATATPDGPLSADATAYDATDVRTLVSTGDTCPDRGVSDKAVVLGKGWDWVLDGGTARYTGTHMTSFDWPAVDAVRTGDSGRVRALISDADVAVDDFECPFFKGFVQHDQGTVFSIDPRVAPAMAKAGYDVVTLGSNHITDGGARGVRETLAGLDAAGIKHVGAGLDLAGAL
ncbi:MAG: CapA family protein, partial [Candidatus Limnocylindrales bacterium]